MKECVLRCGILFTDALETESFDRSRRVLSAERNQTLVFFRSTSNTARFYMTVETAGRVACAAAPYDSELTSADADIIYTNLNNPRSKWGCTEFDHVRAVGTYELVLTYHTFNADGAPVRVQRGGYTMFCVMHGWTKNAYL